MAKWIVLQKSVEVQHYVYHVDADFLEDALNRVNERPQDFRHEGHLIDSETSFIGAWESDDPYDV